MRYSAYGIVLTALVSGPLWAGNVSQLEQDLKAAPSATQFLTEKCAALKLASPPVIKAVRENETRAASAEIRELLAVDSDTPLGYRRVQLSCGSHVLSEADNWYVPGRLTAGMNQILDTTDTPFGAVVKPLQFRRRILKIETVNGQGITVTAVLVTGQGKPISLVVENYSPELASNR